MGFGVEAEGGAIEMEGWGPEFGVVVGDEAGEAAAGPGGPGDAFAMAGRGVLVGGGVGAVGDADAVAGEFDQPGAGEDAAAIDGSAGPGCRQGPPGISLQPMLSALARATTDVESLERS